MLAKFLAVSGIVAFMLPLSASSVGADAPVVPKLNDCGTAEIFSLPVGHATDIPFTQFPQVVPTPTPTPSATPTAKPFVDFPADATNRKGQIEYDEPDGRHVSYTPPKPTSQKPALAKTAHHAVPNAPAQAAAKTASGGQYYPVGGAQDPQVSVREVGIASAVVATPSATPSASASTARAADVSGSVKVHVTGLSLGVAHLTLTAGTTCGVAKIDVVPASNRFLLTTGLGASDVPQITYTAAPNPVSSGAPTTATITQVEKSGGELFLPVLANYRLTDFPSLANLYISGGLTAYGGGSQHQLYGLSVGNGEVLVTAGFHSDEINVISGPYGVGQAIPISKPYSYQMRTTKLFAGLTFSTCSIVSLLAPAIGLSPNACDKSTPAPSSSGQGQ